MNPGFSFWNNLHHVLPFSQMVTFQTEYDYHLSLLTFSFPGEKHPLSGLDSLPYLLSLSGDCIPRQD